MFKNMQKMFGVCICQMDEVLGLEMGFSPA